MLRTLFRKFSSAATKTSTVLGTETSRARPVITRAKEFKFSNCSEFGLDEHSTPKQIYKYLHKHVVGQDDAKKALAIAYSKLWVWHF